MIARTKAAGVVAVHCAVAREDLTVVSVSGAPEVDRVAVLAGAYEVAAAVCGDWGRGACSLYDLPLGAGHSWDIAEQEVAVFVREPRLERIAGVALPAWRAQEKLDLRLSPAFGTAPAFETLRELIGPRPDDHCEATQAAVASFTRYGFEAAAVTAMGIRTAAARVRADVASGPPSCALTTRTPRWRSPAGPRRSAAERGRGMGAGDSASCPGLPLFSAWVHAPIEPEDEPPGRSRPDPCAVS